MATTYKITDLSAILSSDVADTDVIALVDVSGDVTHKILVSELKALIRGIITISSTKAGINEVSPDAALHVTGDGATGSTGELVQVIEGTLPELCFKDNFGGGAKGFSIVKYNNTIYYVRTTHAGAYEGYTQHVDLSLGRHFFGGGTAPTATVDLAAGTASYAPLRIRTSVAPSSPNDGDMWQDGTDLKIRINGVTKTVQFV